MTNAALQVESSLKRYEAAPSARELAEQRLDAEQSRFDVGLSTNYFVVQAQRDLATAQNTELRAPARLPQGARGLRAPAGDAGDARGWNYLDQCGCRGRCRGRRSIDQLDHRAVHVFIRDTHNRGQAPVLIDEKNVIIAVIVAAALAGIAFVSDVEPQ